jgi:acetylornithine aminotransferase/acetylornithine/N-succinyldiaminopimelate aminotransferase
MQEKSSVLNTYFRLPIKIKKGDGVYIYDENKKKYLDFASGIAVTNIGHKNSFINDSVKAQIENIWHCSNLFTIPNQEKLAQRLCQISFADKAFFCSSGLEAVECAIKMMRQYYFYKTGDEDSEIIGLKNSFHGRSITALALGGNESSRKGFGHFPKGFKQVESENISELRKSINIKTVGIFIEPVQSEGGVIPLTKKYLQQVRELCYENNILLCLDEVQTGYGRTGKLFAYQNYDIEPDLITLAKGIGNGFPLGACLMKNKIAENISPGRHGSTYGGNPLAMAIGNAVLDIFLQDGFFEEKQEISQYLENKLIELQNDFPKIIKEIRGCGFIWGLEFFDIEAKEILPKIIDTGLVVTKTSNQNTLRILPPLIIGKSHVDEMFNILKRSIKK